MTYATLNTAFPILTNQLPSIVRSPRAAYDDTAGRLKTVFVEYSDTDVKEFDDLRSLLLHIAGQGETLQPVDVDWSGSLHDRVNTASNIQVMVMSRCNHIACCTRIGSGNVLLVSPDTKFKLDNFTDGTIRIVETTALQSNEALVMYCGESDEADVMDGPFLAEIGEDGRVRAFVAENHKNVLGNASDYVRLLKIAA